MSVASPRSRALAKVGRGLAPRSRSRREATLHRKNGPQGPDLHVALCALVVVVVGSNGCQILGCEPRRCQLDDAVGACADGEVCGSDGFCRPVIVELPCGAPPEAAARTLSVSISTSIGVEAMGNELFGIAPTIVTDVRGCTTEGGRPLCPIPLDPGQTPRGIVQPLGALSAPGAEAFAPLLSDDVLAHEHDDSVDVEDAFAVEVLFRTPSNGGDSDVVTQLGPEGGWGIVMRNGTPFFIAGDRAVALALPSDATWRHVLCAVDASAIAAAAAAATPEDERDDDDILCVVDGAVPLSPPAAFPEREGSLFTDGRAPIVLGSNSGTGDPAIVVVRVWNGDVLDATGLIDDGVFGSDANSLDVDSTLDSAGVALQTARIEALAEEARARLARYVGLRVSLDGVPSGGGSSGGGSATFKATNLDLGFPRAQPIEHGRFQRHEFVGGGWPRVAHTAQGLPALLLEPIRADLLEAAWTACAPLSRREILGRAEACDQGTSTLSRTVPIASRGVDDDGVPIRAQLVFSVFADLAGGAPEFLVNDETVCFANNKEDLPGCELEVIEDDDENFVRLVHRFSVPAPTTLNLELKANGIIWSAQLEDGVDPTTPMNGQGVVVLDQIFVRAPLAAGTSSSLRATVASDGSNIIMAPITAIDGGARFGRATSLITLAGTDELGAEQLFFGAVTDIDGVRTFVGEGQGDPFPFLGGVPVRGGVDIGAPVDACPGCTVVPLPVALDGEQSWHTVLFEGVLEPGFLISGELLTQGSVPRPRALDVNVSAPADGCLEHRLADVSFVGCEAGACSENERLVWQLAEGADDPVVVAGPSIDERAVIGAFETALPEANIEEDAALLFEVRFRRDGNGEGALVALVDANDADVLRIDDDDGDAVITTSAGEHTFADVFGAVQGEGGWAQLSCIVAAGLRCTVNAGEPFNVAANLTGAAAPVRARVGDGVVPIAFARVWLLPGLGAPSLVEDGLPPELDDVVPVAAARLMDARVAASFGLVAATRAAPFTVVETRANPSDVEQDGELHTVGPHWPRVVRGGGGAPVYLADAEGEGLVFTGADLASASGTNLDAAFESVGAGRFLLLTHDVEAPGIVALALDQLDATPGVGSDGTLRVVIDGREPFGLRPPSFDGRTLSLTAHLFHIVVSSGGRLSFAADERGVEGGQTLRIGDVDGGGGLPLRMRALRIAAE